MHQSYFDRPWTVLRQQSSARVTDGSLVTQIRSQQMEYSTHAWLGQLPPRQSPPMIFTNMPAAHPVCPWYAQWPTAAFASLPVTDPVAVFQAHQSQGANYAWTSPPYTTASLNPGPVFGTNTTIDRTLGSERTGAVAGYSPLSTTSSSCSLLECNSSNDEAEPFDERKETERLLKIQELADEIVAKNAGSQQEQEDSAKSAPKTPCEGSKAPRPTSRRRKQKFPERSAMPNDPHFRGAVLGMKVEVVRGEPKLTCEHHFINVQRRRVLRRRLRYSCGELSESEEEFGIRIPTDANGKECASCATKVTPLWRDAEDGTPLCNACGIRYKKYKVRCARCWHIPRKIENTGLRCRICGAAYRYTFFRKFSLP